MQTMLLLGTVFAAIVLAVVGIGLLIGKRAAQPSAGPAAPSLRLDDGSGRGVLERLAMISASEEPDAEIRVGSLRRRLIHAGYMKPHAVAVFMGSRVLVATLGPLAVLTVMPLAAPSVPLQTTLLVAAASGLAGYLGPVWWIGWRTSTRQRLVREGFPDALDMLMVCVEAGLGLDAAIARVGDEISVSHPLLSDHLRHVGLELRAGKRREDALRSMADRIGIDEVSSLVGLLVQTDRLGTSMAQALKAYSDDMRAHRMLAAEEKAQTLGVKLAFPLMTMILPALFIAIMSPAVIKIIDVLMPMLGQK